MRKRKGSIISAFLFLLLLCMSAVPKAMAASVEEADRNVQEAEKNVQEAQEKVEDAQEQAEELERQRQQAEEERSILQGELDAVIAEMNEISEKLTDKQEEIQEAEEELVQAKVNENSQYQNMKLRIRYMYESGGFQAIELLLSSESIGDFLNKAEYISKISSYDRDMLFAYQETVKEVQSKEAELEEEYDRLMVLQDELIAKQEEAGRLLDEKNIQLAGIEDAIGSNADLLRELISQAEKEKQKREEAKAAAQSARDRQKAFQEANSPIVISGDGMFTNPCPGAVLSSGFGYRSFDHSFHKGMDLAAPEGTPTYAGAAGTVLYSRWSNSAGNWVVIDHGNGFVTKYMHHSALAVREGEHVEKGQQIGYVGNTGNSFGAHLHFQVEYKGVAVNPQLYL